MFCGKNRPNGTVPTNRDLLFQTLLELHLIVEFTYPYIRKVNNYDGDFPSGEAYMTYSTNDPSIESFRFIFNETGLVKVIENYNISSIDKMYILRKMLDLGEKYGNKTEEYHGEQSSYSNKWIITGYIW